MVARDGHAPDGNHVSRGRLFRGDDLRWLSEAAASTAHLAEVPRDPRQIAALVALVYDAMGWPYESIREYYGGVIVVGDDSAVAHAAWGALRRHFGPRTMLGTGAAGQTAQPRSDDGEVPEAGLRYHWALTVDSDDP
jgi:hypothetical protein